MVPSSHLLLIAIVGAFTIYFYTANRRQQRGLKVLEGVVSFYTKRRYLGGLTNGLADECYTVGLQIHILIKSTYEYTTISIHFKIR